MAVGANGKQYFILKTLVTLDNNGDEIVEGDTITFPKAFENVPAGCVIPPLGSLDPTAVDDNGVPVPHLTWELSEITTDGCVIDIVNTQSVPSAFYSQTFEVQVFVHEQL